MLRILAFFLFVFASTATAQTTRPMGNERIPAPIVIPETGLPQPQEPAMPAPEPGRPIPFGGFKPVTLTPPTLEQVFTEKTATSRQQRNAQPTPYLLYTPGGTTTLNRDPIVVTGAPGSALLGMAEQLDLRQEARRTGRALIYTALPRTPETNTTRLEDRVRDRTNAAQDGATAGQIIDAILQAESLFAAPTLIGLEGTGTLWQDFLCQDRQRSQLPSGMFLMDGTLRADTASGCRPPRLPPLAIYQVIDSRVPAGTNQTIPGEINDGQRLTAASTRSFWAVAAGCNPTPTLTWIPINSGRLALETHNQCRAGGPISLLSMIDGRLSDEQRTILVQTYLNGNLLSAP